MSTSCPGCNKELIVEDKIIKDHKPGYLNVQTCGKIIIKKKGRLAASKLIEAHGGIECHGTIEAKTIISGKTVIMGKTCKWRGDLTAPGCVMHAGAKVIPSQFNIPDDPLGLVDLP